MKLLFDENLSRKLVSRLADLYPGSMHVSEAELVKSPDRDVWEFAKANASLIVLRTRTSTSSPRLLDDHPR